jgi:16S rRNA (guanine527-N7)-methyltransferase
MMVSVVGAEADPAAQLRSGAKALGVTLTDLQVESLLHYQGLLQRWGGVYNLTAVRDGRSIRVQHLLDSLAVVGPLRRHAAGRTLRILDVGSGAGLPGVVIAVAEPGWSVTTVDPVQKKAVFVRQVAGELGSRNLHSVHARVESMPPTALFDLAICRAFASLDKFIALTRNRLTDDGVWVAMKGKWAASEAASLRDGLHVFHVEPVQVPGMDAERCLVWVRATAASRGPNGERRYCTP